VRTLVVLCVDWTLNSLLTSSCCYSVQGAYRSWKVMEFKIEIFQAWKVMESDLGPGKSWKINHKLNCEHYGLPFFNSDLVTNQTHSCNI